MRDWWDRIFKRRTANELRIGDMAYPVRLDPRLPDGVVSLHPADRVHVEVTRSKLEAIAYSVVNLVLRKNADYGDAWQRQGLNGALVRLADKLYRVENLADGHERLVQDENVRETLVDAIGYALLGILYMQENGMGSLDE